MLRSSFLGELKGIQLERQVFNVFGADLGGAKHTVERGALRCFFNCSAAFGFFAFYQADHGKDLHSCVTRGFDRGDCRCARGAHVIHDDHRSSRLAKTLNASSGAVSLLGLAYQKAIDYLRTRSFQSMPGARCCYVADHWVCSQRQSPNSARLELMLSDEIEDRKAGEAAALAT